MFNVFFNILIVHTTICVAFDIGLDLIQEIGNPYRLKHKRQNRELASLDNSSVAFREYWFTQKLDHFRPTYDITWDQRFFLNDLLYEPGGPVFLFIFGETEATAGWMTGGQWFTYAKKVNALCFALEHRYYGESRPFENTSVENLIHLNIEQALADIAFFINKTNEMYKFTLHTKWILFGGSYAGSLVAWARMKYPHLVHGAVASSAPLLAKADFFEYFEEVKNTLYSSSPECVKNIMNANKELKSVVESKTNETDITALFQLCTPFTYTDENVTTMFEMLSEAFAYSVQYNSTTFSITGTCDIMNDESLPLLERYGKLINKFLEVIGVDCITSSYSSLIKFYKYNKYEETAQAARLWLYQTCTELGYHLTSAHETDLFGDLLPMKHFFKKCRDVFGPNFHDNFIIESINRTNAQFGGLRYNSSNVVFTYGSLDPWRTLGISKTIKNASYHVIHVNGMSHCGDMYTLSNTDSEELKAAKRKVFKILSSWLFANKSERRQGSINHPNVPILSY